MILGIGTDIIEVERVKAKIEKGNGFKEAVFSAVEIQYSESKPNSYESYAARFAAKEAFLKAMDVELLNALDLREIEITNLPSGKPQICLYGKMATIAHKLNANKIELSISHIKEMAIAMVIVESKSL